MSNFSRATTEQLEAFKRAGFAGAELDAELRSRALAEEQEREAYTTEKYLTEDFPTLLCAPDCPEHRGGIFTRADFLRMGGFGTQMRDGAQGDEFREANKALAPNIAKPDTGFALLGDHTTLARQIRMDGGGRVKADRQRAKDEAFQQARRQQVREQAERTAAAQAEIDAFEIEKRRQGRIRAEAAGISTEKWGPDDPNS